MELEECIKDNFDESLRVYIQSQEYTRLKQQEDRLLSYLQVGLSDIQKQQLGAYLDAATEVHSALASEAYVHGVVEGIALREKGAKGPVDLCSVRTEVERRMVDSRKVKVDFSLEDMDLSEFKGKATYEQIKEYVLEETGLKVSSLYIAQIKKKCGLDVGENFNPAKSENARQPQCTPEKEDAIMQAFRHFGII